jgi:hypothetical protein
LAEPSGTEHGGWRKTHIAVDPDTGRIVAEELTRSDVQDTVPMPALHDLIDPAEVVRRSAMCEIEFLPPGRVPGA